MLTSRSLRSQDALGLPVALPDYLKYLAKHFDEADRRYRRVRQETWAQIELYWRGQQFMGADPYSGIIQALPMDENETDLYFVNNIMLPFIEQIAAEAARSNPKLVAYSDAGEHRRIAGALDAAQHLIDCWKQTFWSAEELQRETKLVLFRSVAFTRTWYDELARVIRSDGIDPLQVRISDRAFTIRESPFLTYEQIAWNFDVTERYGLDKPPGKYAPISPLGDGLAIKRQLEIALNNDGRPDQSSGSYGRGYDPTSLTDEFTCREVARYLDTRVYRNYICRAGTVIPGTNQRLGSDTKLGEIFPAGCKEVRINDEPVAMFDINKNAEWDAYKCMVAAAGFYGVGVENILPQQDWFNEFVSIITAAAVYAGTGITAIDTSKVKNGNVLNKPGSYLAMDDLLPGENVGQYVAHYNTAGLDQSLLQLPTLIKENMQFVSGARNSQVSGLPGEGMDTATGVMNQKSTMDSFAAKSLVLRAWNLARRMEQATALFQQHNVYPQPYQRFGETQAKWLRAADIGVDIKVRPEEDSEQPRTNHDMRLDTAFAVQLGYGNPQVPQALQQHLGKIAHMPEALDRSAIWATIAQKRIDAMQDAAKMAEQLMAERQVPAEAVAPFVVQQVAQAAAPQPRDDHGLIVAAYDSFVCSDWFTSSSESFQAALYQVIEAHEAAGKQKAQQQAQEMQAMAAPPPDPQQQQQIEQQHEQELAAQQQAQLQHEQEIAHTEDQKAQDRALQLHDREAERAHKTDITAAQLGTQVELARLKAKETDAKIKAQVQVAKMRPKPTARPKAK